MSSERERAQAEARLHLTEVGPPSGQGRRSLVALRGLSLSCGSATVLGAHPDMEAQDRRWNWPWLGRRRQRANSRSSTPGYVSARHRLMFTPMRISMSETVTGPRSPRTAARADEACCQLGATACRCDGMRRMYSFRRAAFKVSLGLTCRLKRALLEFAHAACAASN